MKSCRTAIATLALVFMFSMSTYASEGIIHTEKTPPPPPAAGIIHTEKAEPTPEVALTEIALGLLQTLLPLL